MVELLVQKTPLSSENLLLLQTVAPNNQFTKAIKQLNEAKNSMELPHAAALQEGIPCRQNLIPNKFIPTNNDLFDEDLQSLAGIHQLVDSFIEKTFCNPRLFNTPALNNNPQALHKISDLAVYFSTLITSHPKSHQLLDMLNDKQLIKLLAMLPSSNASQSVHPPHQQLRLKLAKRIVSNNYRSVRKLPIDLQSNMDVAKEAIINKAKALEILPEPLRGNETLVHLASARKFGFKQMQPADQLRYKNDFDFARAALKITGKNYNELSDNLKNNKELSLMAVMQNSELFKQIPEQFRDDFEVVTSVFIKFYNTPSSHKNFFNLISPRLKNDKVLAKQFLSKSTYIYKLLSNELKADPDIINIIMNQPDPWLRRYRYQSLYKFFPQQLRANPEIYKYAVVRPENIKYLPKNIWANQQEIKTITQNTNYRHYKKIPDFLLQDREFIINLFQKGKLIDLPPNFKNDREACLHFYVGALNSSRSISVKEAREQLPRRYLQDPSFFADVVRIDHDLFETLTPQMKAKPEVAQAYQRAKVRHNQHSPQTQNATANAQQAQQAQQPHQDPNLKEAFGLPFYSI